MSSAIVHLWPQNLCPERCRNIKVHYGYSVPVGTLQIVHFIVNICRDMPTFPYGTFSLAFIYRPNIAFQYILIGRIKEILMHLCVFFFIEYICIYLILDKQCLNCLSHFFFVCVCVWTKAYSKYGWIAALLLSAAAAVR